MDMINMEPLFQGKNSADQLVKIFEVLGYPNDEEKDIMGYKSDANVVGVTGNTLHTALGLEAEDKMVDLLKKMLQYNFNKRISAKESFSLI